MKAVVLRMWREQRVLFLAFVLAFGVVVFFTGRITATWIYWANPAHQNVDIRSWMTPGYVAKSYKMPPQPMFQALDYQPIPGKPRSIRDISNETGQPVEEIIGKLEAAITDFHASEAAKHQGDAP